MWDGILYRWIRDLGHFDHPDRAHGRHAARLRPGPGECPEWGSATGAKPWRRLAGMINLDGKIVLVTAARGIGAATVRRIVRMAARPSSITRNQAAH